MGLIFVGVELDEVSKRRRYSGATMSWRGGGTKREIRCRKECEKGIVRLGKKEKRNAISGKKTGYPEGE